MRNTFCIKSIAFMWLSLVSGVAFASNIQVFSISTKPFNGHLGDVKPCYLDLASKKLNEVNADIKGDSHITGAQMRNRYSKQFKAISDSVVCKYKAKELGIAKLPAIVFDNKYVVYGVLNLAEAQHLYQGYKERQS